MELLKNYINGQWVEADSGGVLDVENPSTGAVLATITLIGFERGRPLRA